MSVEQALALLGTRPGACAAEVSRAYRHTLRRERPDLPGRVDGTFLARARKARDVLLQVAGPDRRRRRRTPAARPAPTVRLLRQATWRPEAEAPATFDTLL